MATHEFTGSVPAPAAEVYAFLADIRNLPRYLPLMTAARPLTGDEVEIETEVKGGTHTLRAWLRTDDAERRIEWGSVQEAGYHGWLTVADAEDASAQISYGLTTPRDHNLEPYLRAATTFVTTALTT